MSRTVPGGAPPEWTGEPERGQGYDGQQGAQGTGAQGNGAQGTGYGPGASPLYGTQYEPRYGYGGPPYAPAPPYAPGPPYAPAPPYAPGPPAQGPGGAPGYGPGSDVPRGYEGARRYDARGQHGQYADGPRHPGHGVGQGQGGGAQGYGGAQGQGDAQAQGGAPARTGRRAGQGAGRRPPGRKVRFRRTRGFFRRTPVRIVSAVLAVFLVWVLFSAGQTAFKNNGQGVSANLAEWARDHYLGPVVTFGEWLSYNPPKAGGKPSFSLAVPKGQQVTPVKATKARHKGFVPDIPATLKSLAGTPIQGEGQWRVVEKVKGEPAILTTFLRDPAPYVGYVNGVASIDQRLVKFSLRPGTEDPGAANWGVPNYIPAGQRTGLLATFNGGFKLDSAGGGFYLNGIYHGSLVNGAASVVYYKNGSIKIGEWGRDFTLNSSIVGVRQNLKLLVDHGKVAANANSDVLSSWGATLGGGYYVWRSGLGITKDGRIVYVYGPALNAQDLGLLLQRAGAVEGMQMDINPAWMKFDYYEADGHASDPVPTPLLPNQQADPYSYYTPSTRDFTAVYAR